MCCEAKEITKLKKKILCNARVDNDDVSMQLHRQHCFLAREGGARIKQTNEIRPVDWCILWHIYESCHQSNVNCIHTSTLCVLYSCLCFRLYLHFAMDTTVRILWVADRHKGNISAQYTRPNCIRRFQRRSGSTCGVFAMVFHPIVCIQWLHIDDIHYSTMN